MRWVFFFSPLRSNATSSVDFSRALIIQGISFWPARAYCLSRQIRLVRGQWQHETADHLPLTLIRSFHHFDEGEREKVRGSQAGWKRERDDISLRRLPLPFNIRPLSFYMFYVKWSGNQSVILADILCKLHLIKHIKQENLLI